jgi:hypothetical protein
MLSAFRSRNSFARSPIANAGALPRSTASTKPEFHRHRRTSDLSVISRKNAVSFRVCAGRAIVNGANRRLKSGVLPFRPDGQNTC